MSPRARRSESITLPPGNHPGLIRYKDQKSFTSEDRTFTSEKYHDPEKENEGSEAQTIECNHRDDEAERIASASASEACYDSHDFNDSASEWSTKIK